jgi:hypothetical protein
MARGAICVVGESCEKGEQSLLKYRVSVAESAIALPCLASDEPLNH